tara:strand:+ start:1412 stop:1636 length:225 start_codon:yes stop_codon:yes gene_type:complete
MSLAMKRSYSQLHFRLPLLRLVVDGSERHLNCEQLSKRRKSRPLGKDRLGVLFLSQSPEENSKGLFTLHSQKRD